MKKEIKEDFKYLVSSTKLLDKKVVIIFLSIAVLQTISWYITSRYFFRINFYYDVFGDDPNASLYEYVYWFVGDFFTLFVLPVLIIKFLLRDKITGYGVKFGDIKSGVTYSVIFLAVMIPILWFVSGVPEFAEKYPLLQSSKENWNIFLIFETGILLYLFAWEFIWRGFMLFGLEEKFGVYSIFIQMIPFVILHDGKPMLETFSAILGGIALGILAFKTRSFIYGVIVHFGVMFSIDLISVLRSRTGEFGVGLNSLAAIISKIF